MYEYIFNNDISKYKTSQLKTKKKSNRSSGTLKSKMKYDTFLFNNEKNNEK